MLHQVIILQYIQSFLLAFPVISAYYDKRLSGSPGNFQGLVLANHLFYKAFQVVSKSIYAYGIHIITIMYGISVQLYNKDPNKAKQNRPLKSAGWTSHKALGLCWRRYE